MWLLGSPQATTWSGTWKYLNQHKNDSRTAAYAFKMCNVLLKIMDAYPQGEIP
jgi:hypothetical protein